MGETKKKLGRPNKYETHIKPYIVQIAQWKRNGATDEQVCEQLGVSRSVYYEAKKNYKDFSDALKNSREGFIADLKGELARLAFKHTLKTLKVYTKTEPDGKTYTHKEKTSKEIDGDIAAIHLLLKNLDPNWHNDDSATIDIKREQLRIAREKMENDNW